MRLLTFYVLIKFSGTPNPPPPHLLTLPPFLKGKLLAKNILIMMLAGMYYKHVSDPHMGRGHTKNKQTSNLYTVLTL